MSVIELSFDLKKLTMISSNVRTGALTHPRLPFAFQFWTLLVFGVLSLVCSLFIIYRYVSNRATLMALHNHTILVLIVANVLLILTDVSWMLDGLRHDGEVSFRTTAFCLTWWFIDYTLYTMQTVVLAWASIERHILIFHSKYVLTRRQKLLFHYAPLLVLIVYLLTFHFGILIVPPCENRFNFDLIECGIEPCYLTIRLLAIWDKLVHNVLPTLIIAIFNVALLYRIIAQKKRVRQPMDWRKHRRMSMQLLSVSAVYLFLNLPIMIIFLIEILDKNKDTTSSYGIELYIFFSTYMVTLSLPFVVCFNYISIDKHRLLRISPTASILHHRRTATNHASVIE